VAIKNECIKPVAARTHPLHLVERVDNPTDNNSTTTARSFVIQEVMLISLIDQPSLETRRIFPVPIPARVNGYFLTEDKELKAPKWLT